MTLAASSFQAPRVAPHTRISESSGPRIQPSTALLGLGTATPGVVQRQDRLGEQFARLWKLSGVSLNRWRRIIRGSQIDTRGAVVPIETVPNLTTAQRMRIYEREAPTLAETAARRALDASGMTPDRITDLIIVSCTGFSAPGVDVELVDRLGLNTDIRRSTIGFMGCFGGVTGLRAAHGACAADPESCALLVCVELCSLHLRPSHDMDNQIASALFADGAAAAVLAGADLMDRALCGSMKTSHSGLRVIRSPGLSRLFPDSRDAMSWRITDHGFAMTLSPSVPRTLEVDLSSVVGIAAPEPRSFAVHPGGAAILDAVERSLGHTGALGLDAARQVMREHGNMSSASVLFVLDKLFERDAPTPIMLIAFGPGLTIDTITVE